MAPDVILEIDHISPVKDGGNDNILNLITSCFDCNRGKGARKLSDNQTLKKQQEQLKLINEKREQLKLLVQWKEELDAFENEQLEIIEDLFSESTGHHFSEHGKIRIKNTIKRYGFEETLECTKISIAQYYNGSNESIEKTFDFINRICATRQKQELNPWLYKTKYIEGIIRNRFGIFNHKRLKHALEELVVSEDDYEDVKNIACDARNWTEFWTWINETYGTEY
ncbi:MAG: HNH endonuclease [Ruminococcaceae bacterium]|jgi:hypothetical protein|nr:HNH endonuclease [Oscillospiraceae bacterium]